MSWLQWHGETWPTTTDHAALRVHLWPPNAACPRQSWSLILDHTIREPGPASIAADYYRSLSVELSELHFQAPDWRGLSGWEIRADPAWQDAHEYIAEYGHLTRAEVSVQ